MMAERGRQKYSVCEPLQWLKNWKEKSLISVRCVALWTLHITFFVRYLQLDEFVSKEIKEGKISPLPARFFVLHLGISLFTQCSFPQFIIFFSPLFYFVDNPHKPYCLASLLLTYIKETEYHDQRTSTLVCRAVLDRPKSIPSSPYKKKHLSDPHLISKYVRRDAETTSLTAEFLGLSQSV